MEKWFKIYRYNDIEHLKRCDENDLIASLVRVGYELYLTDEFICFKIGVDDVIEEIEK